MNSLIRFIVKYQFFLLFLVLEIFSFWLLARHTYYQSSKIENVTRSITGYTSRKIDNFSQYLFLKESNQKLAQENLDLRNKLALVTSKLEKQQLADVDTSINTQFIFSPAIIVNNSINKQHNFLTLNVGSSAGVEKEMGVVTNDGIIGIIAGVSSNYSTVISLLNVDLKISAKLKKSNHFGSLYWDGRNYREVILTDIPQHVPISIGDTVVTSGFSSIFPPEVRIGTIKSFDSKGSNFYTIRVLLFIDFKKQHDVWVVKNTHGDEREILEKSLLE